MCTSTAQRMCEQALSVALSGSGTIATSAVRIPTHSHTSLMYSMLRRRQRSRCIAAKCISPRWDSIRTTLFLSDNVYVYSTRTLFCRTLTVGLRCGWPHYIDEDKLCVSYLQPVHKIQQWMYHWFTQTQTIKRLYWGLVQVLVTVTHKKCR